MRLHTPAAGDIDVTAVGECIMSACVLSICLSIHAIHGEASGHHNSGAPTHSRSHVYSVNRCVCVPRPFLLELIISLFGNNNIYMVAEQVRG